MPVRIAITKRQEITNAGLGMDRGEETRESGNWQSKEQFSRKEGSPVSKCCLRDPVRQGLLNDH